MKIIILTLSLIGLIISAYLTYVHYTTNLGICFGDNNCNFVLTSKFSQIYGIPLSLIGSIYFFLLLLLIIFFKKTSYYFISLLGMIIGFILIYLQVFVIKSLCYYCLVVDIILIILPFLIILNNRLNR